MRCPGEKELILFQYKDLAKKRLLEITGHIKDCSQCQERLLELSMLFKQEKPFELDPGELQRMLQFARVSSERSPSIILSLQDMFRNLSNFLINRIFYQPKLAFATAFVLIALIIIPIQRKEAMYQENMLQIQLDMALGDEEIDLFIDFYSLEG